MSWATHKSGPAVVVRITGVRALRLTPEEARELAVALPWSRLRIARSAPRKAKRGPRARKDARVLERADIS